MSTSSEAMVSLKRTALAEALRMCYQLGRVDGTKNAEANVHKLGAILRMVLGETNQQHVMPAQHLMSIKSGWVQKRKVKKAGQFSSWKRRYLKMTAEAMYYYKGPKEAPIGTWPLASITSVRLVTSSKENHCLLIQGKRFSYQLTTASQDGSIVEWLVEMQKQNGELRVVGVGDTPPPGNAGDRGSILGRLTGYQSSPMFRRKKGAEPKVESVTANPGWPEIHPDPPAFLFCALSDLSRRGTSAEGIFRLSATREAVSELEKRWQAGEDVALNMWSIHIVACATKRFLRDMREPLTTYAGYAPLMETLDLVSDSERLALLRETVDQLPTGNQVVLKKLLALLRSISRHSQTTLMDSSNLAMVFAPGIMGGKGQTDTEMMMDVKRMQRVIELMINHADVLGVADEEPNVDEASAANGPGDETMRVEMDDIMGELEELMGPGDETMQMDDIMGELDGIFEAVDSGSPAVGAPSGGDVSTAGVGGAESLLSAVSPRRRLYEYHSDDSTSSSEESMADSVYDTEAYVPFQI